jgi:hypothetical protein
MVLILVLKMLERVLGFLQDLVLPGEQLGAEVLALSVIHKRLFFGRPVAVQAKLVFFGRPGSVLVRRPRLLFLLPQHPAATPSTATPPLAASL